MGSGHNQPDTLAAVLAYAEDDASMDYLYDFFEHDLEQRLAVERQFIPPGLEDVLADSSLADYTWLWINDAGVNGFRQYLRDGGFAEDEIQAAYIAKREEWGMNVPPHLTWLAEDGFDESSLGL